MAKAIPNPDGSRRTLRGANGGALAGLNYAVESETVGAAGTHHPDGFWGDDNPLTADPPLVPAAPRPEPALDKERLLEENHQLREIIAELQAERHNREDSTAAQGEREQQYELLLEEKTELIRELHQKLQEVEASVPKARTPKEDELITMSEEMERERCQLRQQQLELEELRQRLTEDEQVMQKEMRDMEVQMACERADFARRRSELQRTLDEIRRELEKAERNGDLSSRLEQLRKRFGDVSNPRPAGSNDTPPEVTVPPPPARSARTGPTQDSSLLRRFFGRPEN